MTQKNSSNPKKQGKTGILPPQAVTTTGKYQKSPQVIVGKHKEKTCLKSRFSLLRKDIIFCSPSAVISRKRLTYAAFGGIIIKKHGGVRAIKFRRIL